MTELQLPLKLCIRDDATFINFYKGNNQQLLACLHEFINNDEFYIYLCGPKGVGKTHLLQACCHAMQAKQLPVIYLALGGNHDLTPEILEGMEQLALVCIDDIQAVLGDVLWEEALFNFYNKAKERGTKLCVTGDDVPLALACRLLDLRSRLTAGLTFQITPLNDQQKLLALQARAHRRGLSLSRDVGWYLLRRYSRNMHDLFNVLETLDRASLVAQKRLTIPFVKKVLQEAAYQFSEETL